MSGRVRVLGCSWHWPAALPGVRCRPPRVLPFPLLVALAACGGGGDFGPTPTPSASPTPPAGPAWNEVAPLRDAAASTGRLVGAAVTSGLLTSEPVYAAAFARHFNYLTAEYEMKWDPIEKTRGQLNFAAADALVGFAQQHGMQVKGHALLWHQAVPTWVQSVPSSELRGVVEEHVRAVAGRFRGRLHAWDVVNEAISDSQAGLRDTIFSRALGADYVADAFAMARRADPEAQLIYNDYGGEGLNRKSNDIYELVKDLKRRGLVDGVGLQMHISASSYPSAADIAANIKRLANLGLQVNISEMDVRISSLPAGTKWDRQRQVYREVIAACVAEPRCEAVTMWGFTDKHTWVDAQFGADDPLLFDEQYRVKPAFYGVEDAYLGR